MCTGSLAAEALANDRLVRQLLAEMAALHNQLSCDRAANQLDSAAESRLLNSIAERSIQIEAVFKAKPVSYTVLQAVKADSAKYRPSKRQLQSALAGYLAQELSATGTSPANCLTVSPMTKGGAGYKFLAFESVLAFDMVLKTLKALDKGLAPVVVLYNKYRSNYFLYASGCEQEGGPELFGECFEAVESQIRTSNPETFVVSSGKNYRVLKCPENTANSSNKNAPKVYFTF